MLKLSVFLSFLLLFISATATSAAEFSSPYLANDNARLETSPNGLRLCTELNNLEIDEIQIEGETFQTVVIPGEGSICQSGLPILPAITRFVVVSPQAGLDLIVKTAEPRRMKAEYQPVVFTDDLMYSIQEADEGIKGSKPEDESETCLKEGLFPPVIAQMSEPIVIRGVRLVKVTTYPVQYNLSTGEYIYHDHIEAEIILTDEEPVNPVTHLDRANRSRTFLRFIEGLAINGDVVRRDQPDDAIPEYVGHYLIVTNENCLEYAAPFIEWRRKAGYKVDILSLNNNDAQNPNTVKDRIQDIYDSYLENGTDPFDEILLIGDRSSYSSGPQPQWELEAHPGESIWGNPAHADYKYACLEGNDNHPDVGFSRWPNGNRDLMELVVGKTLTYEIDPPIDEPEWFNKAGVYSQHWGNSPTSGWHISIQITARWGFELLEYLGFEDISTYEDFDWDQQGQRIGPWLRDMYNDGVNVLIGRAQNYYWRNNFNGVNDNYAFPIDLMIGGHSFTAENMFRNGSGDHLKGPVAVTCCWGYPSRASMNAVWLELVSGVLIKDLPLGWGRLMGVTAFESYFPDIRVSNQPVYLHVKTDVDCYGDPGIQPWIGVPTVVDADFSEILHPETRVLNVRVSEHENNDLTVEAAQVTIYHPGDMPAPDSDEYAEYDGMFMMTTTSDEEGMARFILPEEMDLEPGTMYLTVTGRDILPCFNEIEVGQPENIVELGEYDLFEIEGNNNGNINPGEQFVLLMEAVNLSEDNVAHDVTAVLSCPSPWVELQGEEIHFGDLDPGETLMGDEGAILNFSSSCPDGASRPATKPVIEIEFSSGENRWDSIIELETVAPNMIVRQVIEGDIIQAEMNEIDIELENIGSLDMPPFSAELLTLSYAVSVVDNEARYPGIDSGEYSRLEGDPFIVSGNALAIPGSRCEMVLVLRGENDFVDSAYFELQVGEPRENTPTGPDDYGYICFDDTDEDWEQAPEYDWIEISPEEEERDFDGELIDLDTNPMYDIGTAEVIDLGFTTQFYGEQYEQITVGSNGFICMGAQEGIVSFANWPMDRAIGGGMGMIAPFWDDLRLRDDSGVYYYYDEEEARFIVEWYKIGTATDHNAELTFQVVLYDPRSYPTFTGDPQILIQYLNISNEENIRGGDDAWYDNTPYASVGISSPDGRTGISYTWNNEYPISAVPLEARRTLLFTTTIRDFSQGLVYGRVTDAETEEPLEGVFVMTSFGQSALSDEEGEWRIENALTGFVFNLLFFKRGWNDSLVVGLMLDDEESLEVNVALLHPEIRSSVDEITASMNPDQQYETNFVLWNDGNGTLEWSVEKRLPENAQFDPWELRQSYSASDTVHDIRIEGVVFVDDHFYVSGANIWEREDGENMIYVLNREGELIDEFVQPCSSRYGMRDLAWDGELIWGSGADLVYGFTPDGELVRSFEGSYDPNSAITWDSHREVLWVAGRVSSEIVAFDTSGNEVDRIPRFDLRMYGFAYWEDDPDGYPLYVFHSPDSQSQLVYKIDTENRDTLFVTELFTEDGGTPGGAQITSRFDPYSTVFICIANNSGNDRIDMWQITGNTFWFNVTPVEGDINAGEFEVFNFTFDTFELDTVLYEGELLYDHNALGFEMSIPVALRVSMDDAPDGDDSEPPLDFEITAIYPNPFNALTQIMYSVPSEAHVTISVYDLSGRIITTLTDETVTAGQRQVVWDGSAVASGIYFVRLSAPEITSTRKVMLIR